MNRASRSQPPSRQQGLVVVELAIVAVFLTFMVMVTAEFGRLFYQYNELTKALRPAVRYLSEHSRSPSGAFEIKDADAVTARHLILYGSPNNTGHPRFSGLTSEAISISHDGTHVQVHVIWVYSGLFGSTLPAFHFSNDDIDTGTLVLRAGLAMRALN